MKHIFTNTSSFSSSASFLSMSNKSKVLARNIAAVQMAQRMLPLMAPIRYGSTTIQVGTIDQKQKLWILGQDPKGHVYYVYNNELKALTKNIFLEGYFIGQVANEVYRRTAWIIPASKAVVGFSAGVLCGMLAIEGLIAGIVVAAMKIGALINLHSKEVAKIWTHLPVVVQNIVWFSITCPTLYRKMEAVIGEGAWAAIKSAPSGVTAGDVANLLGRVLGGAHRGLMGKAPEATLTALWNCVGRPLISAGLHLPSTIARGTMQEKKAVSSAIVAAIKAQTINVSPNEAAAIQRELTTVANAFQKLDALQKALKEIEPAMNTLIKKWNKI